MFGITRPRIEPGSSGLLATLYQLGQWAGLCRLSNKSWLKTINCFSISNLKNYKFFFIFIGYVLLIHVVFKICISSNLSTSQLDLENVTVCFSGGEDSPSKWGVQEWHYIWWWGSSFWALSNILGSHLWVLTMGQRDFFFTKKCIHEHKMIVIPYLQVITYPQTSWHVVKINQSIDWITD